MLRPLLVLSAVVTLTGAELMFVVPSQLDISSCPITIYGQKYEAVFVNFTSQNLVICFKGFLVSGTRNDCVFGPPPDSDSAGFQIYPRIPVLETIVRYSVPAVQSSMDCFFTFSFQHNGGYATLALIKFGSLSVLYVYTPAIGTMVVDVQVDGKTVDSLTVTNTPDNKQTRGYLDMSGCRDSGVVYKPGTEVKTPETCVTVTCDKALVLKTSTCGPLEVCQGNGSCISPTLSHSMSPTLSNPPSLGFICTVTGPAVVDFHGHVDSVEDRCAYSLLSVPSVPGFQVSANFRERRRKDVSFLDSVTLRPDGSGVRITLKQGGRVLLNDSTLTLNSSAQLVHGVQLSKDQTGVTAKASLSNFTTSVFFDGYTAQIRLTGLPGSLLQGLCENSSRSLSERRLSESSSTSCVTHYTDTNDSSINCTKMTERCNLLKQQPFSSCSIDPQPYITACTNTLCEYPAVDGLQCQFLEAYARACSLMNNATLEGWRSKAECSPPEAFCQDRTCSDQEFCGEKTDGGETRCFCRPITASKYREENALGDPMVCSQNSASLTLLGCLLEDKGIDYSVLHLRDPSCRGQVDEQTHMVTFSFNSSNRCGAEVTNNNNQIIYKNTITNQNRSDIITVRNQIYIGVSCVYNRYKEANINTFRFPSSSVIRIVTSSVWNYTLTMTAYTDAERTRAVQPGSEVQLNQKIWVELKTSGLDEDLIAVVTDSCWATNQKSENGSLRYDLIVNGCPNAADQTVQVEGNGRGTSNHFSFNMFQFSGSFGDVYLHCKVQLCVKQENSCIPKCDGAQGRRSKRSIRSIRSSRSKRQSPALIRMVWTH